MAGISYIAYFKPKFKKLNDTIAKQDKEITRLNKVITSKAKYQSKRGLQLIERSEGNNGESNWRTYKELNYLDYYPNRLLD
jgi:hypothetical protein